MLLKFGSDCVFLHNKPRICELLQICKKLSVKRLTVKTQKFKMAAD